MRCLTVRCLVAFCMWISLLSAHDGFAADTDESPTYTVFGDLMKLAADYQIRDASGNTMQLEEKPILFWSNPTRHKDQKGCLVIWSDDGRPQVIGSMFTFVYANEIRLKHAYHSVSDEALVASYKGRSVWEPSTGTQWKMAEMARPRENPRLRLVQMRSLARQFTGYLENLRSETSQLELKPTPLHRYASEKHGVIDGAIFSFALGTDPEILMLIEAIEGEDGKATWRYAFARFHYYRVFINDKSGKLAWEGEQQRELQTVRLGDPIVFRRPYVSFHVDRQFIGLGDN